MEDPFADMRRAREEREENTAREWQRRQAADQRANRMASQYHEMVKSVLEQLRQAVYPRYEVKGHSLFPECKDSRDIFSPEHRYMGASWRIGIYHQGSEGDIGGTPDWLEQAVTVELIWDNSFQPLHFKIRRSGSYRRQKPMPPVPPPKKTWFGRSAKAPTTPQRVEYEDVQFEPLIVELSQEALAKALRQLHPAGSY